MPCCGKAARLAANQRGPIVARASSEQKKALAEVEKKGLEDLTDEERLQLQRIRTP